MSHPIDPLRPVERRARDRRDSERRSAERRTGPAKAAGSNLPVPISAARAEPASAAPTGDAAFAAQLIGQGGIKRGLKGGQPVLDEARSAYLEAEFSGPDDRRKSAGKVTRKNI
jgi:hypothetical protein